MNNIVESEINKAQGKMGGYLALLMFRYSNLCVKAELGSLIPVTIQKDFEDHNLEEFADTGIPNDYQLSVFPKDPKDRDDIIAGIFEAHPEFKMQIVSADGSDKEEMKYLLYTMPDVDKDRRDFLLNAVKGLCEECKARIDMTYGKYKARFVELLVSLPPEEADEANQKLEDAYKLHKEKAEEILDTKRDEIEDAYFHYVQKHLSDEENQGYDVTQGIRMFPAEE